MEPSWRIPLMRSVLIHYMNPLHIYCRLVEIGMLKSKARHLCSLYERYFFKKLFCK